MLSVHWTFQATADSGNSEGITTFRCLAINTRSQTVADKFIDVQVAIPGEIDTDRSSVVVEEVPSDETQRKITVNCAISGRPLPEVLFFHTTTSTSEMYTAFDVDMPDGPDTTISTGQNEAIAQKVYTMSVDELRQSGEFTCQTLGYLGLTPGNVTSHNFYVAGPDL
ncbi:hypothetical protein ElyMa_006645300 [Elysia marginata]|uniref:Ig-like domain-containing protein n=1 Tax=Elysia marginata TaxID=1093978 RepID=A0AAV4IKT6_9GAST|nr:hypothetical protein ElyMa_006645300 [Elysia marginata]